MPVTVDQARRAYATGWAVSGGPLTARVRAGVNVATDLAIEHADAPNILETTLRLGALEGLWARIYQRRERLYVDHDRAIGAAWQAFTDATLDVPALITACRQAAQRYETTSDQQQRQRDRHAAVTAAVLAALLALLTRTRHPGYTALVAAVEAAIRDGVAEGTAGAIAIAAQKAGYSAVDFDRAFTDARANGATTDAYQGRATRWLRDLTNTIGRVLGRRLGGLIDDGADDDTLTREIQDTGTSRGGRVIHAAVDLAMGAAFTLGGLAFFGALNVLQVNWITAGSGNVCPTCQSHEAANPWPVDTAPQPPQHPNCRCVLEPAAPVGGLIRFGRYLIGGRGASTSTSRS